MQALAEVHGAAFRNFDTSPADLGEQSSECDEERQIEFDPMLVERAKLIDAQHRERHQRPVSAEGLRKALGIGAQRSRALTRMVRAESSGRVGMTSGTAM